MWASTSAADSGDVQKGTSRGKTMNTQYADFRTIHYAIAARYPQPRRTRRDSSLEIIRRTMARRARQENNPGRDR